jgi:hypothetical protein
VSDDLNMYDLPPCPKCRSVYRAPFIRSGEPIAECDACGFEEAPPPEHYVWRDERVVMRPAKAAKKKGGG